MCVYRNTPCISPYKNWFNTVKLYVEGFFNPSILLLFLTIEIDVNKKWNSGLFLFCVWIRCPYRKKEMHPLAVWNLQKSMLTLIWNLLNGSLIKLWSLCPRCAHLGFSWVSICWMMLSIQAIRSRTMVKKRNFSAVSTRRALRPSQASSRPFQASTTSRSVAWMLSALPPAYWAWSREDVSWNCWTWGEENQESNPWSKL